MSGLWWPWRFVVRRVARAHGFLDPITVLNRLHRLAQPAEVVAPTELLRMGAVLHARGLMNSQTIQHNLDWIWPHWIVRQYDPADPAFVPRAFSLTHINLTHRNWTAIGLPDRASWPLVDPRGLVTPLLDGWSLDGWVLDEDGVALAPSRLPAVSQTLVLDGTLAVVTQAEREGLTLRTRAEVLERDGRLVCRLEAAASSPRPAWLVIALRPYNPEGVSFIHHIEQWPDASGWRVDGKHHVAFSAMPERTGFSHYRQGDVFRRLPDVKDAGGVRSHAGLGSAAALFAVTPGASRAIEVTVPLDERPPRRSLRRDGPRDGWPASLTGSGALRIPDARMQFLYEAALRTLILHTPGDVYAGPFTYRRFWFRDAAFILHALSCAGLLERAERALDRFPPRQTRRGYFRSQDGEWDSNGQALWILGRFCALTGRPAKPSWRRAIIDGARWIGRKRVPAHPDAPHAGLLPAGFSAEHFGPNDYYYWDDFWAVAGLRAAAELARGWGDGVRADRFAAEADELLASIERSLAGAARSNQTQGMPASPYRRMDAGAVGSLAAGYPLQLVAPTDPRLIATAEYLLREEFVDGGFFQEIGHSGINPYLTLHVAQVLLRAGDPRWWPLVGAVAGLASPTGQWPEAVHPRTRGGCMGDGQHVWAAAEWAQLWRESFVHEEAGGLVLGAGIPPDWQRGPAPCSYGPTPTPWGPVAVTLSPSPRSVVVEWSASWRGAPPRVTIRLPGLRPTEAPCEARRAEIPR